jgi:hypothetical protein
MVVSHRGLITLIFQPKRPIIHAEILIWIIKIDQSGNIMWQKNIWRQQFDWVQSLIETPDGGYILVHLIRISRGKK